MATRLYFRAVEAAAVSPAFSSGWTNTASASRRRLAPNVLASDTVASLGTVFNAGEVALARQHVSDPMPAGIDLGAVTVKCYGGVREDDLADNVTSRLAIRVVSNDGTIERATLLAPGHYGTGNEYLTSIRVRRFAHNQALASYTTQSGDRLVVELGHGDTAGTTPVGRINVGSSQASDASENEASTSGNAWIEFSADLSFITGAKLGTRFLGTGATFAVLAADVSQDMTNMTATATSITEDPAPRYNRSHPRTLVWRATATTSTSGVIYAQSDGGGGQATHIDISGGTLRPFVAGVQVSALALPGVSGSAQTFLCGWTSMANPDTTGASDAVVSWLVAYNVATGAVARVRFTHAAKASTTARASWGDRDGAGTNPYNGTITMVGLHWRTMTLTELVNDFVSTAPAHSTEFVEERAPVPIDLGTGIHDVDEHHGPAAAWAAHNHRLLRRRLATPLHVRYLTQPLMRHVSASGLAWKSKLRLAPGSTQYQWYLGWLHAWPVPAGCNEAFVQLHVRGSSASEKHTDVGLRVYSFNRLPNAQGIGLQQGAGAPDPYEQFFVSTLVERVTLESNANGLHVALGRLPLARAQNGQTYIVVAYAIDPADDFAGQPEQEDMRVQIGDVLVSPGYREQDNGGVGLGG